jgi:hypothetical protein
MSCLTLSFFANGTGVTERDTDALCGAQRFFFFLVNKITRTRTNQRCFFFRVSFALFFFGVCVWMQSG